ncbi:hypothetical protein PNOK_0397200 [Pyrrhoderma noxium]|uniref:Uncharacterized protein n=1 Tax=Pyrrhoderma noxium TaxID=2282107 RepID=A0A286UPE8_9AGAM|nr:hypothetical protein PNOK_0397200 [Pyrrhoderma noxium]
MARERSKKDRPEEKNYLGSELCSDTLLSNRMSFCACQYCHISLDLIGEKNPNLEDIEVKELVSTLKTNRNNNKQK